MKDRNLEIKVGAFVLFGLVATGVLVVAFGRFGDMFNRSYQIVVSFPNASGIIKNSQVLYRGAKVGSVITAPEIINQGEAVDLTLRIRSNVKIPENAKFRIGVYGLLGDRYVDIVSPPPDKMSPDFLKDGEHVAEMQEQAKGLEDVAEQMQPIIKRMDDISEKLNKEILTEKTVKDISESVASARSFLARADRFMAETESGKGTIYMLMKDPQVAQNLRDTIANMKQLSYNLRARGILFYKDLSKDTPPDSGDAKSPQAKKQGR